MIIIITTIVFLASTIITGFAVIKLCKLEYLVHKHFIPLLALSWLLGTSIFSIISYIAWCFGKSPDIRQFLWLISAISFLYTYTIIFTKKSLCLVLIAVFSVPTTIYTSGYNFDLLWDAKASWLLKAKSFSSEYGFPGPLLDNPIAINIAKDYPPWISHWYSSLAVWNGQWSEVAVKYIQSYIILLCCSLFLYCVWYVIVNSSLKLKKLDGFWISLVVVMTTYGSSYFYLYSQSGYVDFAMTIYWLVVVFFGILLTRFPDNTSYWTAFLITITASLLSKNESASLIVFGSVVTGYFLYKQLISWKLLIKPILISLPFVLIFVSWQVIKLKLGYSSGFTPPESSIGELIVRFVFREAIVITLYIWELFRNFGLWFVSYSLFLFSIITLGLVSWNSYRSKLWSHVHILGIAFLFSLVMYILPYGIADLGIGFYFESTRDRIALQLLPPTVLVTIAVYTKFVEKKL